MAEEIRTPQMPGLPLTPTKMSVFRLTVVGQQYFDLLCNLRQLVEAALRVRPPGRENPALYVEFERVVVHVLHLLAASNAELLVGWLEHSHPMVLHRFQSSMQSQTEAFATAERRLAWLRDPDIQHWLGELVRQSDPLVLQALEAYQHLSWCARLFPASTDEQMFKLPGRAMGMRGWYARFVRSEALVDLIDLRVLWNHCEPSREHIQELHALLAAVPSTTLEFASAHHEVRGLLASRGSNLMRQGFVMAECFLLHELMELRLSTLDEFKKWLKSQKIAYTVHKQQFSLLETPQTTGPVGQRTELVISWYRQRLQKLLSATPPLIRSEVTVPREPGSA
jgi:hypothetical protein